MKKLQRGGTMKPFKTMYIWMSVFLVLAFAAPATGGDMLLTVAGTGPFENNLILVDPNTCDARSIGITQDSPSGPTRKIRGLAYDKVNDVLYGVTREGDIVKVNRFTGETTWQGTVHETGVENFWSGLTLNATGDTLYTVNAFGSHNVRPFSLTSMQALPALGPTVAFGSNFQILGLALDDNGLMYGANRTNDNIVAVSVFDGSLDFSWTNVVVGENNRQQITVDPQKNGLWSIHDHSPDSDNATLAYMDFSTSTPPEQTFRCTLPFGIVEDVGGGNDTYGWGGLTFVPDMPEHFTCYKVKPSKVKLQLDSLEDQFLYQEDVLVKGPVELCAPADKNGEGVNNWEGHLVCYKVYSKQKVKESVVVKNQFGTQLLHVKGKTRRLCVPSKKRLCNDVYWTDWLDRDNPGGVGDWETIGAFLNDNPPVQICGGNDPVGIKCRTLDGTDWQATGEADLICDPSYGFRCKNEDQPDGRCEDYEVRFQCCK
jgi:hypothetical protein